MRDRVKKLQRREEKDGREDGCKRRLLYRDQEIVLLREKLAEKVNQEEEVWNIKVEAARHEKDKRNIEKDKQKKWMKRKCLGREKPDGPPWRVFWEVSYTVKIGLVIEHLRFVYT